ncbi:MAG TPA: methyltransferase [Myxococcota bacterium]|nr:methyltransferase [Myxococcota bacterium]
MLIRDRLREQGERLFRGRSFLPLLLLPLGLLALWQSRDLGTRLGTPYEWLCLGISAAGLALRFAVAGCIPRGSSGRRTRSGLISDELNTTGAYSLMRHPLYLANFLLFLGFLLGFGGFWPALTGSLIFWLYYERIALSEEHYLEREFGERYLAWARETPALLPDFRRWRPPALHFRLRSALKREYRTLCGTLLAFGLLHLLRDSLARGRFALEPATAWLLAGAALAFGLLRFLHKRTFFLHAPGR